MKKFFAFIFCASLFFCATLFAASDGEAAGKNNGAAYAASTRDKKILIAYFTWADNSGVENKEESIRAAMKHFASVGSKSSFTDIDALSAASLHAPGNVAVLAGYIKERVGGEMFSVRTEKPYSAVYDECLEEASDEKARGARPPLKERVENIGDYDVVFLGYPNWWYGVPMAIFSFIETHDLSGKTVIPFCAHGTGGLAASVRDIREALPKDAKLLKPIGVYRLDINSSRGEVEKWLAELGY